VISGGRAACERAVNLAGDVGCRAVQLKVAGAFHSPLMQSAADELGRVLATVEIKPPRIPVLSNVTGEYHRDPESIRRLLCEQVTKPVRWQAGMERMLADGFTSFIEVGPNRVLTGMMRKIQRKAEAISVGTLEAVKKREYVAAN
jgi:[acyl-carrier-protein] S-malonyltransferase